LSLKNQRIIPGVSEMFRFSQGLVSEFSKELHIYKCLPREWNNDGLDAKLDLDFLEKNIIVSRENWIELKSFLTKSIDIDFVCKNENLKKAIIHYFSHDLKKRKRLFSSQNKRAIPIKKFFAKNKEFLKKFTVNIIEGREPDVVYHAFKGKRIVDIRYHLFLVLKNKVVKLFRKFTSIHTKFKKLINSKIIKKVIEMLKCLKRTNKDHKAFKNIPSGIERGLMILKSKPHIRNNLIYDMFCHYKKTRELIDILNKYNSVIGAERTEILGRFVGKFLSILDHLIK